MAGATPELRGKTTPEIALLVAKGEVDQEKAAEHVADSARRKLESKVKEYRQLVG